ncbi:GNAT family N-acetyltransferase, partial [Saprospiraceae bacterium]|nr:GNAT family N-acetyltransferase [Saprospiraceae bacterium]
VSLQTANTKEMLSPSDIKNKGYVTVHHSLDLLNNMHSQHPHFIIKEQEKVIGYALFMSRELEDVIPILQPMFDRIRLLKYNGAALHSSDYFIMGQVCIDTNYRGQRLASKLYNFMFDYMRSKFEYIITEVSSYNKPSTALHISTGFEIIDTYSTDTDKWNILIKKL